MSHFQLHILAIKRDDGTRHTRFDEISSPFFTFTPYTPNYNIGSIGKWFSLNDAFTDTEVSMILHSVHWSSPKIHSKMESVRFITSIFIQILYITHSSFFTFIDFHWFSWKNGDVFPSPSTGHASRRSTAWTWRRWRRFQLRRLERRRPEAEAKRAAFQVVAEMLGPTAIGHKENMAGWWFFIFHILGIIIPIDFHIFQRVSNHQPENIELGVGFITYIIIMGSYDIYLSIVSGYGWLVVRIYPNGGFLKWGYPHSWMVYKGKFPWRGNLQIFQWEYYGTIYRILWKMLW